MRETTIHWLAGGTYADIATCDKKLLAGLERLKCKPHATYRDGSGEFRIPLSYVQLLFHPDRRDMEEHTTFYK